jgi:hypothetical protein
MDNKIDKIISIIRSLKEDGGAAVGLGGVANYSGSSFSGPTNSLAPGKIAGTPQAGDYPPVDKKKRNRYIYPKQKGYRNIWKRKPPQ